jgi:hypothetical protein
MEMIIGEVISLTRQDGAFIQHISCSHTVSMMKNGIVTQESMNCPHLLAATTALASAISLAPGVPIRLNLKFKEFSSMINLRSSWGENNITDAPEVFGMM